MPATSREKQRLKKANRPVFTPPNFTNYRRQPKVNLNALPLGADPLRQYGFEEAQKSIIIPNLILEGIDENTSDVGVPDTNGDVGGEHYVQIVNASWFQVFSKDGTPLTPPTSANTIWNEIGESSFSDPVIIFDEEANRWLLTDLANIDEVLYGVSETSDPLGAWNLYTFSTPGFADYPKYGIFPQAYLLTVNEGGGAFPVYAINRQQLLAGAASIDIQRIDIPDLNGGFPTATPMDWNGATPPPTDELFVVRMNDDAWGNESNDRLEVWTINLDWADANNTTADLLSLPTAPYDSDGCSIGGGFDYQCIPQPNPDMGIDGIMTIIMNRVIYHNFGTHESAVLTFSVDAGNNIAGIRWMELRRSPGEDWSLYQEGTFAPEDGLHRFIGGIAINGRGDIGLAYSVSSEEKFPSLRFTGRRAGDALGEMTIEEVEFATGEGIRTSTERYGDYASMSVDPIDNSFWFTSEYVKEDGSFGTKIVNFSLGRDTIDIAPIALLTPDNSALLGASEPVTVQIRNLGLTPVADISLGYFFNGDAPVIEPAALDTLFPDSTYTHTFATTVNMEVIGNYTFKLFTNLASDQNVRNDTLVRIRKKLARFDVAVTDLGGLNGIICDSIVSTAVMITNLGVETLNSLDLSYQLNGGTVQTQAWTGSLPSGESAIVNLVLAPLTSGSNTLSVRALNPNGQTDEIPDNDQLARAFNVNLNGVDITLNLTFDGYPEETSWQLQDQQGNILFTGGDYGGQDNQTIEVHWCLVEEECYQFVLLDSYGDGLFDPFGPDGTYNITDASGNVLASVIQVNFGDEEINEFCVERPCTLAADIDLTPASTNSQADGAILITVTAGVSPFQFSINGGNTFQSEPLFDELPGGNYNVVVRDANDCTISRQVTVGTLVATDELTNNYAITVFPNPSANGAFQVKVEGLSEGYHTLEVQIVSATGQVLGYQTLSGMDDIQLGLVSLRAYPAGVYYLRFKHDQINQLVRIIRL